MNDDQAIINQFLDQTGDRQADLRRIFELVSAAVPELQPHLFDMTSFQAIAWGLYHYRYASGREGDWPLIALANQKNYISLYVCCVDKDQQYLPERYRDQLGRASVGKSCIRFKRADDLNSATVKIIARQAGDWLRAQAGRTVAS